MADFISEDEPDKGRLSRSSRLAQKTAQEVAAASAYRKASSGQKTEKFLEGGKYGDILRYAKGKSGIKKNNPFGNKVIYDSEKDQITIIKKSLGRTKITTLSINGDKTGFYLSEIKKTQGSYRSFSIFNESGELTYLNRAKANDHYLERWEQNTSGKLVRTLHRYRDRGLRMEDALATEGGRNVLVRKEAGKTYAKFIIDQDYNLKTLFNKQDTGYSEEIKYADSGRFSDSYVRRFGGLIQSDTRSTWAPNPSRDARSGDRDNIGPPSAVPLYETGRARTRRKIGPYESRTTLNDDQSVASRETQYFPGFSKKESYDSGDQKTVTRKLFGISFTYQRDLTPQEIDDRAERQAKHEQNQLNWKENGGEVRTVDGAKMQNPVGFDPLAYGMARAEFGLSGNMRNEKEGRPVFRYAPNPEWDAALENFASDRRDMGQPGHNPARDGMEGMVPPPADPQAVAHQRSARPTAYGQQPVASVDQRIGNFGGQRILPEQYGRSTPNGLLDPDEDGMEGMGHPPAIPQFGPSLPWDRPPSRSQPPTQKSTAPYGRLSVDQLISDLGEQRNARGRSGRSVTDGPRLDPDIDGMEGYDNASSVQGRALPEQSERAAQHVPMSDLTAEHFLNNFEAELGQVRRSGRGAPSGPRFEPDIEGTEGYDNAPSSQRPVLPERSERMAERTSMPDLTAEHFLNNFEAELRGAGRGGRGAAIGPDSHPNREGMEGMHGTPAVSQSPAQGGGGRVPDQTQPPRSLDPVQLPNVDQLIRSHESAARGSLDRRPRGGNTRQA